MKLWPKINVTYKDQNGLQLITNSRRKPGKTCVQTKVFKSQKVWPSPTPSLVPVYWNCLPLFSALSPLSISWASSINYVRLAENQWRREEVEASKAAKSGDF